MLTEKQIEKNKEKFLSLIKTLEIENADIEGLVNMLEHSDFFYAPASTQYHCAFEGGLCYHSLNVYEQMLKLIEIEYPTTVVSTGTEDIELCDKENPYTKDTIKVVSLLHDISKMNFYETAYRNVKDEQGNWTKVPFIKTKDMKDRFLYSTHGANSEYIIGRYIPLTLEESIAIINHMGGKEAGSNGFDATLSEIFNRFPLAILLHTADMLATFMDEAI